MTLTPEERADAIERGLKFTWKLKPGHRRALINVFKERNAPARRAFAFTAVPAVDTIGDCHQLAVAEFGIGGYSPISTGYCRFDIGEGEAAHAYADELNRGELQLSETDAARIVGDTMKRPAGMKS